MYVSFVHLLCTSVHMYISYLSLYICTSLRIFVHLLRIVVHMYNSYLSLYICTSPTYLCTSPTNRCTYVHLLRIFVHLLRIVVHMYISHVPLYISSVHLYISYVCHFVHLTPPSLLHIWIISMFNWFNFSASFPSFHFFYIWLPIRADRS